MSDDDPLAKLRRDVEAALSGSPPPANPDVHSTPVPEPGGAKPPASAGDPSGMGAARELLGLRPGLWYFERLSRAQHPTIPRTEAFDAHRAASKRLYWTCVSLDVFLMYGAALLLLGGTAVLLYKGLVLPIAT